MIALAVVAVMNFTAYWNADKIILRAQGAKEVKEN